MLAVARTDQSLASQKREAFAIDQILCLAVRAPMGERENATTYRRQIKATARDFQYAALLHEA